MTENVSLDHNPLKILFQYILQKIFCLYELGNAFLNHNFSKMVLSMFHKDKIYLLYEVDDLFKTSFIANTLKNASHLKGPFCCMKANMCI